MDLKIAMGSWGKLEGWFNNNVSWKLGVSWEIDFYRHVWLGSQPFQVLFPNLSIIVYAYRSKVGSLGDWFKGT